MPKPASVAKPSLPFAVAVRIAGSEARLRRGAHRSTVSNWRARGVPWNVVGPILLERLESVEGTLVPRERAIAAAVQRAELAVLRRLVREMRRHLAALEARARGKRFSVTVGPAPPE